MDLIKTDLLEERAGRGEFLPGLSGKADNNIGRDRRPVIILTQKAHALRIFFCRIMSVHAAEGLVASALQREMEMRAYFFQTGNGGNKVFRHDPGLQGAQADPLQSLHGVQFCQQTDQRISCAYRVKADGTAFRSQIQSVGTHMNPCQNDFADTVCHQSPDFTQDIALRPAADTAACKGNNTVAAELIASVLNLDVGAGMSGTCQIHIFKRRSAGEIFPEGRLCLHSPGSLRPVFLPFPLCQKTGENLSDLRLFVVADHKIDGIVRLHSCGVCLHIASHCNDNRVRILFFCPVQHLTAFAVRDIGHGAGIDNVNIRLVLERYFLKTFVTQNLAHDIQFITIHFAAKIMKSNSFFQMFISCDKKRAKNISRFR